MTWETLAPWIAICFTLALSILVPLFTQIANNSHQRKMQREKMDYEQKQKIYFAYESFMKDVGAVITYRSQENMPAAGASIAIIYLYAPQNWLGDLDKLLNLVRKYEWDDAEIIFRKLCRLIAEDLQAGKRDNS